MYFLHLFPIVCLLLSNATCQLYNSNDNVYIYKSSNFSQILSNSSTSNWLIQFYHSYCGHCQNFAPKFKEFLKEAKEWSRIIKFGVIDCNGNREFCHTQGISGFPSFKLYKPTVGFQSKFLSTRNVDRFFTKTIKMIDEELQPHILKPITNVEKLSNTNYLKISGPNNIDLQRAVLTYYDRVRYPLYYESPSDETEVLTLKFHSVDITSINKTVNLQELYSLLDNYADNYKTDMPTKFELEAANNRTTDKDTKNITKKTQISPVYNQDIYSSVWFALSTEVSGNMLFDEKKLIHLTTFVEMLKEYSGLDSNIINGFEQLIKSLNKQLYYLRNNKKMIMSWEKMLRISGLPHINATWIGCKGSTQFSRRYPCGLWTTFHVMTVNHYNKYHQSALPNDTRSVELMESIRNFIFDFFSCLECAHNFRKETHNYLQYATSPSKLLIYFWTVHNSVNKRLAGADTEDPKFPKVAFPTRSVCPGCWKFANSDNVVWPTDSQWNMEYVVPFLVEYYSQHNRVSLTTVSSIYMPIRSMTVDGNSYNRSTTSWGQIYIPQLDLSLCFILSISCSLLVFSIFVKFAHESKWCRSKRFNRLFCSSRNVNI